jgi:membrane-bound serine protease (ClpP class)
MTLAERVGRAGAGAPASSAPTRRALRPILVGVLLALATLAACEHSAIAQLPFPLFGGDDDAPSPKKPASDSKKEDEDREKADDDGEKPAKAYAKPSPFVLPDGPADKLRGPVVVVKFDGIVNPGLAEFTIHSIERAAAEHAQAVLIEIDTPGGLVSSTERIVQAILRSETPVIVYVSPSGAHAASAGTFITLAGHVAAMAPATRLGAAHPVTGSGKDPESESGKHMGRKVENDLVAFVEGIAKERHRNVEWAIDAVKSSVSINADRALELGVIDLVARDRVELFEKLDGKTLMVGSKKVELSTKDAAVVEYKLSIREWLVNLLANPGIAMILGVLGLIGILVEVYHPGMIAPGVMGVLCIICSLISVEQLPIDIGAAILVLAGIGLLVAEIYSSTHGLLALLGGIGLAVGLLLLIDTKNPSYLIDDSLKLRPGDVLPVVALFLGFVAYLSRFILARRRGPPVSGTAQLVGATGFVLEPVGPQGGMVFVSGEYWRAKAAEAIAEKEEIEVVKVEGLELEVRRKQGG